MIDEEKILKYFEAWIKEKELNKEMLLKKVKKILKELNISEEEYLSFVQQYMSTENREITNKLEKDDKLIANHIFNVMFVCYKQMTDCIQSPNELKTSLHIDYFRIFHAYIEEVGTKQTRMYLKDENDEEHKWLISEMSVEDIKLLMEKSLYEGKDFLSSYIKAKCKEEECSEYEANLTFKKLKKVKFLFTVITKCKQISEEIFCKNNKKE